MLLITNKYSIVFLFYLSKLSRVGLVSFAFALLVADPKMFITLLLAVSLLTVAYYFNHFICIVTFRFILFISYFELTISTVCVRFCHLLLMYLFLLACYFSYFIHYFCLTIVTDHPLRS